MKRETLSIEPSVVPLSEWLREPAGPQSITIGKTRLTHIPDGWAQLDVHQMLPDPSGNDWRELGDYLDGDGYMMASMGGLLIERDGRVMLIDTGFGSMCFALGECPDKRVGGVDTGHIRENLSALGFSAGDIEVVGITHMHGDHINGIFSPGIGGVPRLNFPNARHLFSEDEWNHWVRPDVKGEASREHFIEPMAELMKGGTYASTFRDGDEVFPGVTAWLTPGHSPGHTSYVISDGGVKLVVLGDSIHSPAQMTRDDWEWSTDFDSKRAQGTRRLIFEELSKENVLAYGGHFGSAVFGQVTGTSPSERPTWNRLADIESR